MSFRCPICKKLLSSDSKVYKCENNHSFDIAKEGYVNLSVKNTSSLSGDSKQMCLLRRAFLESGFYEPLAKEIAGVIKGAHPEGNAKIIDAGCGEGYYSRVIRNELYGENSFFGFDLAKEGVRLAAKSEKQCQSEKRISYAVSGIFDMPFEEDFADVIISVFAPISEEEFSRVLKKGGILIVACPGANHLYGLKKALYDVPRENEEKIPEYASFSLTQTKSLTYSITVENEMINALFGMTPYFWKSSREVQEKAKALKKVETECDFIIKVYTCL